MPAGRRPVARRDLPGALDGLKVDAAGRVYVSCYAGVLVFSPDGALLEEIELPGAVNFTIGGRDGSLLPITAHGYCVVIAIVDAWGRLQQLRRIEGTRPVGD